MLSTTLLLMLAYLVGSIPSGYLLVRATSGRDVRQYGSHSVGAINTFRVGGRRIGALTLVADVSKALLMVLLAGAFLAQPWAIAAAALLVMLGHAYSAWFLLSEGRFSEGKSVACCLGVLIALTATGALPWPVLAVPLGVWGTGLLGPRLLTGRWWQISPATMAATVSIPVTAWALQAGVTYLALSVLMAGLILVRHKNNIKRLFAGTEPRLGDRAAAGPSGGKGDLVPSH